MIHLSEGLRQLLADMLDYSIKTQEYILPVKIKELQYEDFEEFKKLASDLKLKNLFKTLSNLPKRYIQFLYEKEYIDLTDSELKKINETFVDLTDIPNNEKQLYQLFDQLKVVLV